MSAEPTLLPLAMPVSIDAESRIGLSQSKACCFRYIVGVGTTDIYVETRIRAPMEELWRHTQDPSLHERWDLRFTSIEYLPRSDASQPQRFRYATRIGFGMRIVGEGESIGERLNDASRTSSLRFWSDDPKSLIRQGSGYWQYVPADGGIRFLTRYDYRTRFGVLGAMIDRLVFRPVLGWATAWSFDRLRLWLERGIEPAVSLRCWLVHAICRVTLAFIWLYQGVVPKLVFRAQSGELGTVRAAGMFDGSEHAVLTAAAVFEILLGVATLVLWRQRWLMLMTIVLLVLLAIAAAVADASLFAGQFNPATLNASMAALALVAWMLGRDLPSARNCRRKPSGTEA